METTVNASKELLHRVSRKTLPGLAFVNQGASKAPYGQKKTKSSADCDGGCGGQCLSGCKDECITVSR
ncbi:MAG: hypothetical protein HGA26_08160 [Chlorobiaceae bacterium]|nr:hypothetical protein [Chlorobiaceae bacterium]